MCIARRIAVRRPTPGNRDSSLTTSSSNFDISPLIDHFDGRNLNPALVTIGDTYFTPVAQRIADRHLRSLVQYENILALRIGRTLDRSRRTHHDRLCGMDALAAPDGRINDRQRERRDGNQSPVKPGLLQRDAADIGADLQVRGTR